MFFESRGCKFSTFFIPKFMKIKLSLLLIFVAIFSKAQQNPYFKINTQPIAFIHATIFQDAENMLTDATLIIENEEIKAVGKDVIIPENAKIIDLKGKYIYPSFIDVYTDFGINSAKKKSSSSLQYEAGHKKALLLNDALHSEINAYSLFEYDQKEANILKTLGFGTVVTHRKDGVSRGTSSLIALTNESNHLIKNPASAHFSFSKGNSQQQYPRSLMGMIALLRQSYYDGKWYEKNEGKVPFNLGWEAWNTQQSLPQIFEANDKLNVLRADEVAKEFDVSYWIKGGGNEYQIVEELKKRKVSLIQTVNFPQAIDVSDPYETDWVYLKDMKEWEWAAKNLAILHQHKIPFALSTADLKDKSIFSKNIQKAIQAGIPEKEIIRALTEIPAKLLNVENQLGSLHKGKKANFLISSSNFFDAKNILYQNWVLGKKNELVDMNALDIRGEYTLNIEEVEYQLNIEGSSKKLSFTLKHDSTKFKMKAIFKEPWLTFQTNLQFEKEQSRFAILMNTQFPIHGKGTNTKGKTISFSLEKTKEFVEKADTSKTKTWEVETQMTYPFQAYGLTKQKTVEKVLFKNATVWTNEEIGILENTDVLIVDGKIQEIGKNLTNKSAKVVDATGKHLTVGIIDEHSHIAIYGGVNEASDAVTSQVRIGDVINHEDINIYRQLGGGVTAIQQLHGSANPIGGQSSLIKLRWGQLPNELKIKNADGFIKFALGENVKQANWGEKYTVRFPQTRMGVEQVYEMIFTEAKLYEKSWKTYLALSKKEQKSAIQPRKDLTLETVLEILNKKRFITCHSYLQSEILMLMQIAEKYNFRVNTFTHVLEGYKIADQIKKHGAYASTFADWWAYKFEVNDAIPYNAALLSKAGVVVAINSDYPEPGRRLNIEAGKLVKYGNMTEEEAWKTVTLNPAKMLHLDEKMGSIKKGKDADIVLWSSNPLSIYAKVEKTYVEGICLYDIQEDLQIQQMIEKERALLIQKLLKAKASGESTVAPTLKKEKYEHCEDIH